MYLFNAEHPLLIDRNMIMKALLENVESSSRSPMSNAEGH